MAFRYPAGAWGLAPCGTDYPCRWGVRRGACFRCRLPTLPLALFLPPSPLPALAERSSRREGGDSKFSYARGCAPCIPGAEPARHLQNLPLCFPVRGLPGWLPVRRALTVPTGGVSVDMRLWLTVPAAKERGDRGRGTSAFEMVLSPGAGITSAVGGTLPRRPSERHLTRPALLFPFPPAQCGRDRPAPCAFPQHPGRKEWWSGHG